MKYSFLIFCILLVVHTTSALADDACSKLGDKTYDVLVPAPPGGATDLLARHLDAGVRKRGKINLLISNVPSASGLVAAQKVLREKKQLLLGAGTTLTVLPYTMGEALKPDAKPLYTAKDFSALGFIAQTDTVLICNKAAISNAKNPEELLAHFRNLKEPNFIYGSTGTAAFPNILFIEFIKAVKEKNKSDKKIQSLQIQEVAYSSLGSIQQSLLSGAVGCFFVSVPSAETFLAADKESKLVVIGSNSPNVKVKGNLVPNLAETIASSKVENVRNWVGLFGAADLPAEIRVCIEQEISAVLNQPDFQKKLTGLNFTLKPKALTGTEFEKFVAGDIPVWTEPIADIRKHLAAESGGAVKAEKTDPK